MHTFILPTENDYTNTSFQLKLVAIFLQRFSGQNVLTMLWFPGNVFYNSV